MAFLHGGAWCFMPLSIGDRWMLTAIRHYIQENRMVSQAQLLRQFQLETSALEPMLIILMQRQEIKQIDPDLCHEQCADCESPIYYELIVSA